MTNHAQAFLDLDEQIARLKRKREAAAIRAFPVGSTVSWEHGNHLRHGKVLGVSDVRVRVQGKTTLTWYWIDGRRIIRVAAPKEPTQ